MGSATLMGYPAGQGALANAELRPHAEGEGHTQDCRLQLTDASAHHGKAPQVEG